MSIGSNIKEMRLNLGLTQEELAEKIGVGRSMIAQIERDTKSVTLQLGKAMANVFKCKVDDLLE